MSYDSWPIRRLTSADAICHQLQVGQTRVPAARGSGEVRRGLRALRTGECLPSIRPLAEELRVNRNTVAKAYAELEAQGVIETHPGKGCFLRSAQSPLRKDARRKALAETLDESVIQAHHLLLSRSDFLRLAEERYDALRTAGTRRCWRKRMNAADTPAIEIRNLVRRYGRTDAVNGLSLTVAPGRCYGFFGRNGAGKTTTIKCLLNLLRPSSGEISVFGMDPARRESPSSRVWPTCPTRRVLSVDDGAADARLLRLVSRPVECRDRTGAALAIPAGPASEDEPPVEGAADAARAHLRDLR
jgi:DNA-binding transcriptional regulator YhcF (GntR family)